MAILNYTNAKHKRVQSLRLIERKTKSEEEEFQDTGERIPFTSGYGRVSSFEHIYIP